MFWNGWRYRWFIGGQALRMLRVLEISQQHGMWPGIKQPELFATLASAVAELFRGAGGPNYVETRLVSEPTGPLILTVRRADGRSPAELRVKAEAERDRWRAEAEAARALLEHQQAITAWGNSAAWDGINRQLSDIYASARKATDA